MKGNRITSIDFSNNPALEYVHCGSNLLSADALNAMFETLHQNDVNDDKMVYVNGNPGAEECNRSIAQNRGWELDW